MNLRLKQFIHQLKQKVRLRYLGGAVLCLFGIGLVIWSLTGRQAAAREDSDEKSSQASNMAVIPAEYEPSLDISEEAVPHMSYQTMIARLTGWVQEFGRVNIRREASIQSEVVGQVVYGDSLTLYEEEGDFTRIRYEMPVSGEILEGYCYTDYLADTPPDPTLIYLNVPLYKQADYRWGSIKIGRYETLASAGCTTSCVSMVESYVNGEDIYPDEVAASLSYTDDGKLTFPGRYSKYYGKDYLSVVLEKLKKGVPCLVSGYTSEGKTHWVVVVGYRGDGESLEFRDFIINDPGSYRNTLEDFFKSYPLFEKIVYYDSAE